MDEEVNKEKAGCIPSWLRLILLGVVIGGVLAGIYALKRGIYGTAVSRQELIGIVVITVIACFVCLFLDRRQRRAPFDPAVSPEKPPPSEWTECCAAGYATFGTFERWVPEKGAVGNLPLTVTQVLEDKTANYHRIILLLTGTVPTDLDVATLRSEFDAWCKAVLAPSRFKGLGVGILLQTNAGSEPNMEVLQKVVDYRARYPATIQWVVWSSEATRAALGVHMCIEGRTTQCFVDLCVKLKETGFAVECRERPAEGILRFALAINRKTPWWLNVLGP